MDNNLQLYDQLLQFPLFQGMSRTELLQMAGNTRFDFRKQKAGSVVASEGDVCAYLIFLVKGSICLQVSSDDRSFHVNEHLASPWLLQPEALFGLSTRYTCTATALSDIQLILLSKDEVLRLFDDFLTFRLNLLNLLSTLSQQRARRLWRRAPHTLADRIVAFFVDHTVYPAGHKEFFILMEQLARHVNDSRLDVSRVLNEMSRSGLIELHRGRIVIPSLERLFM
jgi:CRP-like cAMP-binding protein